jgi:hypothetical protein
MVRPERLIGHGTEGAADGAFNGKLPKTAAMLPGDTLPGTKLAAFTTAMIEGCGFGVATVVIVAENSKPAGPAAFPSSI